MLVDDVRETLAALPLTPADRAASALALHLAAEIDGATEPEDSARFSALLVKLLADLGGSPAGRQRLGVARPAEPSAANPLEAHRLRAVK